MTGEKSPRESNKHEVEGVIRGFAGKRDGGYAIVYPYPDRGFDREVTKDGVRVYPITFEMSDWCGQHPPRKNQVVLLSDIQKFSHGWGARRARPVEYDSGEDENEQVVR